MKLFYRKKQDMVNDFVNNENDKMMQESFETNKSRIIYVLNKLIPILVVIILIYFIIALLGGITIKKRDFLDIRFDVTINNSSLVTRIATKYKNTIIPFALYVESLDTSYYNFHGDLYTKLEKNDKYLLDVRGSYCYYKFNKKEKRTYCRGYSNVSMIFVENNEAKYTNLKIYDNLNENVIYEGNFINDITEYVSNPSEYLITINAEYDHAEAEIKALVTTI